MNRTKLDKTDLKILYELDKNSRQFISQIAKETRLSNEVVDYRIKQLEKKGIIRGYYAVINSYKLGYMFFRAFLKLKKFTSKEKEDMILFSKTLPNIAWIVDIDGNWDIVLVFWARNVLEFNKSYEILMEKFGSLIHSKAISVAKEIYHFQRKMLFSHKHIEEIYIGQPLEYHEIDMLDRKILSTLCKNSRTRLFEIANKTSLSVNSVKYRLSKLMKNKIITGFKLNLDMKLLGYTHYKVFLKLTESTEKSKKKLISHLRFSKSVIYVTNPVGEYDLEFEGLYRTHEELHKVVSQLREQFPEIIEDYSFYVVNKEPQINYLPEETQ